VELGRVRADQGRFNEALEAFSIAGRCNVEPDRVCLLRAQVFERQGKRSEAIQNLREAIQLRPADWEAHDRLGLQLALDNKLQEAISEFWWVVQLRPEKAEGYLNLGIALARQGQYDEALDRLETARRLEPRNKKAGEFIDAIRQRGKAGITQ
jgi:superkiller protein 3